MRIGIDARFLSPQKFGISRYIERLITHLAVVDDHNQYVIFLQSAMFQAWTPPNERWTKVLADYRWYTVAEQLHMPRVFRRAKVDLIHIPHFNVPVLYWQPFVVTIHDLILNQFPTQRATTLEPMPYRMKRMGYHVGIWYAVHRSRAIISVSEYSRQSIVNHLHVPADKVAVTYEAVDPFPPAVEFEQIRRKGVTKPYLLYVGNTYPHKNIEQLIDATIIAHRRGEQFQLVLVGGRDYFSRRLESYAQSQEAPNVLFYGYASDEELSALYTHAQAYFFPSLSEGFGLPGLEAMQAGVPVYAARASCLPEVYGSAAAYFDPHNTDDIAASIKRALHDTIERQRLIAAGRQRYQQFSWSTMAKQTLELYEHTHIRNKTSALRPWS